MSIVLQATRNESDRIILPLRLVSNCVTVDNELFRIEMVPSRGQISPLFSRERDRILTEIALEKDRQQSKVDNVV